jgi:formamidopyrimidine-DNA glycosylase
MPESPDIRVYCEALEKRTLGTTLTAIRLGNPFLLRSVSPPVSEVVGRNVAGVHNLGKRIVIQLDGGMFLVLHLMIAGRLHWKSPGVKIPGKIGLGAFDFTQGTLTLTEAGTKKRASLHLVAGEENLKALDRGGMIVEEGAEEEFAIRLKSENHTLKRSLTDPRLFSGIGNAYSDEILHRAKLSPLRLTRHMTDDEINALFRCTLEVFSEWTDRLRKEARGEFPENVTAFRKEMAVHGKFNQACPVCGTKVQRIVYAQNECNYCPRCQTGGKLLADRAFSRLLKDDWPATIEELEAGSMMKGKESR